MGKRTIGVLTKPDLINDESLDKWKSILMNEKYKLYHG